MKIKKFCFTLLLFLFAISVFAQKDVVETMKRFHILMVEQPKNFILDNYIHDDLTYGHSNGWVENRTEFKNNLGSYLLYHSIKEDSIQVAVSKKIAHIRFNARIEGSLNGQKAVYNLKVLEVWVKKGNWKLFARQAVRKPD